MHEHAPTIERLGPYRLLEELGAGAMGTVYLAEDVDEEGRFALKVLHPHLLEHEGFFQRFQREAMAGKKVKHPNVVGTLDSGFHVHDGTAYCVLAMEYVEGRTLRDLLREWGTVPEALVRAIGAQVAAGLEAIHQAGIVHRDLKPENVLITADDEIRIMDLGVARVVDATRALTKEGQFTGSLLYAAPEQFGRGEVGPAVDLYALGVLLYELSVGTNPFAYAEPQAVMRAHLDEEPVRLDRQGSEVSPFLAEVTATLLQKSPAARFESAGLLQRVLKDGEASSWWAQRAHALRRAQQRIPQVPVRRDTRIYGREAETTALREAWTAACRGGGNTVLLLGEAGIGKSRLVDHLLGDVIETDARVLYASHAPSGGGGGIAAALLRNLGETDLGKTLNGLLPTSAPLVPALTAWLRSEEPPEGALSVQGDALHAVLVRLTRSLANEKPLLFVIEDLHFACVEERKLLLSLARGVSGHRVLLLLTTRPGLDEAELSLFDRVDDFQRVEPGRLGARDIIRLLRDAFRSERLVEKLGPRIAEKSDGVPLFVFEMIEGLKEGQFIEQRPDGSWIDTKAIDDIEVPSTVKDLIAARLKDLSEEERAILDVGAVQGFEFDPGLVAAALEQKRVTVLQRLAAVERRSGVVRSAEDAYRFDHHQIQEVVYAALPDLLRREYHTLLADAFEGRKDATANPPGERPGDAAWFLARHHLCGRTPDRSLPLLEAALVHLLKVHQHEAALELCDLALSSPALCVGAHRKTVLWLKCEHLEFARDLDTMRETAEEALSLSQLEGDEPGEARGLWAVGKVLAWQGHLDEARDLFERAVVLARTASLPRLEVQALGMLGDLALTAGCMAEAREFIELSLARARALGNARLETSAELGLGTLCWRLGQYDQARELYGHAVKRAIDCGARQSEAVALLDLGLVEWSQGFYSAAEELLEQSLELSREIGYRPGEANAIGNLGALCNVQGRLSEALEKTERARCLARETGDRGEEANAVHGLGTAAATLGRCAEARAYLERGFALSRETGERALEGYALVGLAQLSASEGSLSEAIGLATKALNVRRSIGTPLEVAWSLLIRGRMLIDIGEHEAAGADLTPAIALARAHGLLDVEMLALAHEARRTSGTFAEALGVHDRCAERLDPRAVMEVRFLAWQATHQREHLVEARRLLQELLVTLPAEYRAHILQSDTTLRGIEEAWKEQEECEREP